MNVFPPSDDCRIHVVDRRLGAKNCCGPSFTPSASPGENSDRYDPIQVAALATRQAITATSCEIARPHDGLLESP